MTADEQPGYSGPAHLAKYAFKPGQCGNPNGRPKGRVDLVGLLDKNLASAPPGMPLRTWAEQFVQKTILDAYNGDPMSRRLVWEYMAGKPGALVAGADAEDLPIIVDDA